MSTKNIRFSGNYLVVDGGSKFTADTFASIKDADTETSEIVVNPEKKEIFSVKKVFKQIYNEGRFVSVYFNQGNKYPYPTKVVNEDLEERDNPRAPGLIELDQQIFLLLDTHTQRMWVSEQRKRKEIAAWVGEKIGKRITVKSVFNETEFIEKIKSVQEISFTVVPNLFTLSGQDTLSNHLAQDIYGFDAEKAKLQFFYKKSGVTDKIKDKFNKLIGRPDEFQDVTVIGRDDDNLEVIFNTEEVATRITIEVNVDDLSKQFDVSAVFPNLIKKIISP